MAEGIFGLAGVLLGFTVTLYLKSREQKERYKIMTFEKRLEVYQKLYYFNQTLWGNMGVVGGPDDVLNQLKEYWKNNSLYVDDNTSKSTFALISSTQNYIIQLNNRNRDQSVFNQMETVFMDKLRTNLENISSGAGIAHLSNVTAIAPQNSPIAQPEIKVSLISKLWSWIKLNKYIVPFIVITIGGVIYFIYFSFQVTPDDYHTQSYATIQAYKYTFYSIASLIGLFVVLINAKNKVTYGLAFLTIWLFMAGMVFELFSFIVI